MSKAFTREDDDAPDPFDVQMIGQWVVNRLDVRVGEQLFIAPVRGGNAQRGRRFSGLAEVARRERGQLGQGATAHRRQTDVQRETARASLMLFVGMAVRGIKRYQIAEGHLLQ